MKRLLFVITFLHVSCHTQKDKTDSDVNINKTQSLQHSRDELELLYVKAFALRSIMSLTAKGGEEKTFYRYYVIEELALLKGLEEFVPQVVVNENNRFGDVNGDFQELSTGKAAKKWTITECKVIGDTAKVVVCWHSGSLAGGGTALYLERKKSGWTVVSNQGLPSS